MHFSKFRCVDFSCQRLYVGQKKKKLAIFPLLSNTPSNEFHSNEWGEYCVYVVATLPLPVKIPVYFLYLTIRVLFCLCEACSNLLCTSQRVNHCAKSPIKYPDPLNYLSPHISNFSYCYCQVGLYAARTSSIVPNFTLLKVHGIFFFKNSRRSRHLSREHIQSFDYAKKKKKNPLENNYYCITSIKLDLFSFRGLGVRFSQVDLNGRCDYLKRVGQCSHCFIVSGIRLDIRIL